MDTFNKIKDWCSSFIVAGFIVTMMVFFITIAIKSIHYMISFILGYNIDLSLVATLFIISTIIIGVFIYDSQSA